MVIPETKSFSKGNGRAVLLQSQDGTNYVLSPVVREILCQVALSRVVREILCQV